ncbi:hypothetical protein GGR56DRAFT_255558 [Xylariaceae sp. FL0804]|nr:hypothetical protein GGR56DRAFT_255558 [Xylariaceae sp. FL0804]
MPVNQIGPIRQAWYKWKALRLPWRKRFLVGLDLSGNTYWEFRLVRPPRDANPVHPGNGRDAEDARWRRIVQYPRSAHLSDVAVPPAWHQWLRHRRAAPPSLAEQRADVARRDRARALAAEADARWEAKPSLLDRPPPPPSTTDTKEKHNKVEGRAEEANKHQQPAPPLDTGRTQPQEQAAAMRQDPAGPPPPVADGDGGGRGGGSKKPKAPAQAEDPWKRASGPSERWQPEAWTPSAAKKR